MNNIIKFKSKKYNFIIENLENADLCCKVGICECGEKCENCDAHYYIQKILKCLQKTT